MISKPLAALAKTVLSNPKSSEGEKAFAKAVLADEDPPGFLGGELPPWTESSGTPNFIHGGRPTQPPGSSGKDPIVTAPTSNGGPPIVTAPKSKGDLPQALHGAQLEELNRGMRVVPDRPQFERLPSGELVTRNIGPMRAARLRAGSR